MIDNIRKQIQRKNKTVKLWDKIDSQITTQIDNSIKHKIWNHMWQLIIDNSMTIWDKNSLVIKTGLKNSVN